MGLPHYVPAHPRDGGQLRQSSDKRNLFIYCCIGRLVGPRSDTYRTFDVTVPRITNLCSEDVSPGQTGGRREQAKYAGSSCPIRERLGDTFEWLVHVP